MENKIIGANIRELDNLAEAIKNISKTLEAKLKLVTSYSFSKFNQGVGYSVELGYSFACYEAGIKVYNDERLSDEEIENIQQNHLKLLGEKTFPYLMYCELNKEKIGTIYFHKFDD